MLSIACNVDESMNAAAEVRALKGACKVAVWSESHASCMHRLNELSALRRPCIQGLKVQDSFILF